MNRFLRSYLIILGVATVAYLVRVFSGQFTPRLNLILWLISIVVATITWELLRFINNTLNKYLPFEKGVARRIVVQLACGSILALFGRFMLYRFGEPNLPFSLDKLFVATTWVLFVFATAAINSIFFMQYFFDRWKDSLVKAERLEKEKSDVQFDNLKNQLNPHFLFNALTSLNSLISENPELASQFLQNLSRVYRYVLQNKEKNFVSVGTELDFISHYVFLAETRFSESLKIHFDIPHALRDKAIVPVTLQILIENALKHNIIDAQRPLTIKIYTEGDYLIVSNNLQLKRMVEASNKQGLENLKSLYHFLTSKPILIEEINGWFNVKIPLL